MNGKKRKSVADSKLKLASSMAIQADLNEISREQSDPELVDELENYQYSEKFTREMDEIFREEERQINRNRRHRVIRVAAVAAILVVGGGAIASGTAEAFRLKIFNNYFRKKVIHTEMISDEGNPEIQSLRKKYPKMYFPDTIPEGLKAEVRVYDEKNERYFLRCYNEEDFFQVSQTKSAKITLDTEKTAMKHADFSGITYYWTEDEEGSSITWVQDTYQFVATSSYKIKYALPLVRSIKER